MYGEPFSTIPVEKLVALFRTAKAMHSPRVKILKAHYNCEGHAATARQLANLVGYKGHQGVNLQYGKFVQALALEYGETNIPNRYHTDWLRFLMDYTREPNQEGVLTLWDNVVQALRELGW